jgi:sugar transferase EpsL
MTVLYTRLGKRFFDLIVTLPATIAFAPVIGILALFLRVCQGPAVFFCQLRPGRDGHPFSLYKFRTMTYEKNAQGNLWPDELRITRIGKFLRNTSLDESAELWNVIKGDMSLVGPRPLLMQYLDRYSPEQARRHDVKPGITGWAQINGRNALTWEEKFNLDLWYVQNISFWIDLQILALTLWKVLKREGINQPGQATMGEFMGNGRF